MSALPEPSTRFPSLYLREQNRYDRAVGKVLAAIGDNEKAIERFKHLELFAGTMYESGRNRASQLMYAMGPRLDLYRDLGRDEEAKARCAELQSRYPEPYAEHRPFACIIYGVGNSG